MGILDAFLPHIGNPYLDDALRGHVGRAVDAVRGLLPPDVTQAADFALAGLQPGDTPVVAADGVVAQNPSRRRNPTPLAGPVDDTDKSAFIRDMLALDGGLLGSLGRRGSGKTALCLKLAQEYHDRGRPVFVIGIPQRVLTGFGFHEIPLLKIRSKGRGGRPDIEREVPNWQALRDLPRNCVLVIDDVAVLAGNRSYGENEALHQLIVESRHKHIVVIFNAHNSAGIDKYLLQCNVLFLKPSSSMSNDLERGGLSTLAARSEAAYRRMPPERRKGVVYAVSDELNFEGFIQYTPPRGWSRRVSEHHSGR